jgi:DNA-binding XRE family transcriptional regulator
MAHPLRRYRAQHDNMPQVELAKLLGVSRMTVIRWETGRRKPKPSQVAQISEKTGISARELRPDLAEMLERA